MPTSTPEEIKVGEVAIRFLVEAEQSAGSVAVFEFEVPPGVRVPVAHSHVARACPTARYRRRGARPPLPRCQASGARLHHSARRVVEEDADPVALSATYTRPG